MDRNTFLAFFLSALVIIGYYFFFPPQAPQNQLPTEPTAVETDQIKATVATQAEKLGLNQPEPATQPNGNSDANVAIVSQEYTSDKYTLELTNRGGAITSLRLAEYVKQIEEKEPFYQPLVDFVLGKKPTPVEPPDPNRKVEMANPATPEQYYPLTLSLRNNQPVIFGSLTESAGLEQGVTLSANDNGLAVEQSIVGEPNSYLVDVTLTITNTSDSPTSISPKLMLGTGNEAIASEHTPNTKVGFYYFDKTLEKYSAKDLQESPVKTDQFNWFGVYSKYFVIAAKSPGEGWQADLTGTPSSEPNAPGVVPLAQLVNTAVVLNPGESQTHTFNLYIGPKYVVEMDKFDINMVETLDMTLNFIAQPMLSALRVFHDFSGNWGLAIILLTIVVRILIFPLAYKGMTGMQKMAKLTPKVQALKKKYGTDKERFNREVMAMYKKHKANPMGGCLPLLVQLPIFFALYSALMPAIELRYQPFVLWMTNLSSMDYTFILPALCGVTMYFQQKITPTPATADPVQVKIMRFFPVMMSIFFAFAVSGLVLYWTVSGFISVLQQIIFNKINQKRAAKETDTD